MSTDEQYMLRALYLAKLGSSNVATNPLVGACIVHNNIIIGEGYHKNFGGPHAEVNAINSVRNKELLKEATIYVTLEPCAHFGKTPPCANLLIEYKLKRAVIGMKDPFALVDGKGIKILENAGIGVTVGVLEDKARMLNKRFITYHTKKRPYITLKWAETENGFIAPLENSNEIFWISQPETQIITHKLRSTEQAILVGRKTIQKDNPSLTTRAIKGTNPIRIVLDPELKLNNSYSVFGKEGKIIVLNKVKNDEIANCSFVKLIDFSTSSILDAIYKQGINSVLIEGGTNTLQHFIDANSWDEALVIKGKMTLETGMPAPFFQNKPDKITHFKNDILCEFTNLLSDIE